MARTILLGGYVIKVYQPTRSLRSENSMALVRPRCQTSEQTLGCRGSDTLELVTCQSPFLPKPEHFKKKLFRLSYYYYVGLVYIYCNSSFTNLLYCIPHFQLMNLFLNFSQFSILVILFPVSKFLNIILFMAILVALYTAMTMV